MANYSYVIDSHFRPYSFKEMITPLAMYKEEYEKVEDAYNNLSKLDRFKELVAKEGEEKAAQIYQAYADEYDKQYQDFLRNGLNINNRRGLTNLKRRYAGEIGRLERAEERLNAEMKNRDALRAKGVHMLYSNENPRISDYLDNDVPNQYGISTDDLYARGAAAGKAFTLKMFESGDGGSVMNGYYRKWVENQGLNPDRLNKFQQEAMLRGFREAATTIPELQQIAISGLEGLGVYDNLSGSNLRQAELNYLNGIIDGAIYKTDVKPIEDKSKMSAAEAARLAETKRQHDFQWRVSGYDENGIYHPELDQAVKKARAIKEAQASVSNSNSRSTGSSGRSAGSNKLTQSAERLKISWKGNNPNDTNEAADQDYEISTVEKTETGHPGKLVNYEQLPTYAKNIADEIIGDGDADLYQFYFQPYEKGGLWGALNDTEAELEIVPRDIKDFKQSETLDSSIFSNY